MDVYNIAFAILEVSMFVLGNAISIVRVPKLVQARSLSLLKFKKLSGSIFLFSLLLSFFMVPLQYFLFDKIVHVLAPGFSEEKVLLVKNTFLYFLPMICIYLPYYAFVSFFRSLNLFSIANCLDFLIALLSVLYIVIMQTNQITIIPSSFSFAYILSFCVGLYFAKKIRIIGFFDSLVSSEIKSVYKNIIKLSAWFLIVQLYVVVDKSFASYLKDGMISSYVYASILICGFCFIFDFASIYLTKFSYNTDKNELFELAIKLYMFLTFPLIVFLILHSNDLVSIIYGYGKFNFNSILNTSYLLSILSPLIFFGLINNLFQSLYQSQDKYGYIISLAFIGVCLNFLLNYCWIDYLGIRGIAYATLISNSVVFTLNIFILHFKQKIVLRYQSLFFEFIKYFSSCVISIFVIFFIELNFIFKSFLFFALSYLILALLKNEFIIKIYNLVSNRILKKV